MCVLAMLVFFAFVSVGVAEDNLATREVKGMAIADERRTLLGLFPRLHDNKSLDYLLQHLGQNGMFFVGVWPRNMGGHESRFHHHTVHKSWESLARDQSFLNGFGAKKKRWVFGHTNDRQLGRDYGCPREEIWSYGCILMWKTSTDGTHLSRSMPILFNDHVPEKDEIERAVQRVASQRIEPHVHTHTEL
jgi:hypothetical protein